MSHQVKTSDPPGVAPCGREALSMRLSARWAPLVTAFLMSSFMVAIITAVLNLMSERVSVNGWLISFFRVWPIAFVAVLAVLPLVKRLVAAVTEPVSLAQRSSSDASIGSKR